MKCNLDWAGEFQTMAERMRLCESEEQMYQQLKKFKDQFNSDFGNLSRAKRLRRGFRGWEEDD